MIETRESAFVGRAELAENRQQPPGEEVVGGRG
jgi:hypothetical protein